MISLISSIGKASALANSLKGLVVAQEKTTISNLIIDCVHNEDIEFKNSITEHPVENRASISDHVYSESNIVKIEGTITDSNMRIFGIINTPLQSNSLSSITKNIKSLLPFNNSKTPSQIAYNVLEKMVQTKQLVTVATKRRLFKNMVIESLSINENSTTVNRLHFTCVLKQITIVEVKSTNYSRKSIITSSVNTKKSVDVGLTNPVNVEKKPNESFLNKTIDRIIEFIDNAPPDITSPFFLH